MVLACGLTLMRQTLTVRSQPLAKTIRWLERQAPPMTGQTMPSRLFTESAAVHAMDWEAATRRSCWLPKSRNPRRTTMARMVATGNVGRAVGTRHRCVPQSGEFPAVAALQPNGRRTSGIVGSAHWAGGEASQDLLGWPPFRFWSISSGASAKKTADAKTAKARFYRTQDVGAKAPTPKTIHEITSSG